MDYSIKLYERLSLSGEVRDIFHRFLAGPHLALATTSCHLLVHTTSMCGMKASVNLFSYGMDPSFADCKLFQLASMLFGR